MRYSLRYTVATFLFVVSWQVQASRIADPFLQPCADEIISATGQFRAFNEVQCRLATARVRTQSVQQGGTCVCEALLNVAHELGVQGTLRDLQAKHNCERAVFSAVFADYAASSSILSGRVFGGAVGAIVSKSLTSTDEALHQIIRSVSDGHVVAVGLDAKPIYDFYAQRLGVTYSGLGVTRGHALVVRAVMKNSGGKVTDLLVLDSSGPARIYSIPTDVFRKAYGSIRAKLSRGVYISDAIKNL